MVVIFDVGRRSGPMGEVWWLNDGKLGGSMGEAWWLNGGSMVAQ
jgi:hypothetical protein